MSDYDKHEMNLILTDEPIRRLLSRPSIIPRDVRERVAEICAYEMVFGMTYEPRDHERMAHHVGPFFPILMSIRNSVEWSELRHIAERNRVLSMICLKAVLSALFDMMDSILIGQIRSNEPIVKAAFEAMIEESLQLWGRRAGEPEPKSGQQISSMFRDRRVYVNKVVRGTFLPEICRRTEAISLDSDAVELLSLMQPGRGFDYGLTGLNRELIGDIRRYSEIAGRDRALMRLIDKIGRVSRGETSHNPVEKNSGNSEVDSVVLSSYLHYLLPSELIKLKDPTLKLLFFSRWFDGNLFSYRLRDLDVAGAGDEKPKGPAVVLVDTSGSMCGAPGIIARSIVLAMARTMLRQNRDLKVVLFSSIDQVSEIELGGRKKMAREFLDFLRSGFDSGTDFNTALRTGLDSLRQKRYDSADLVFVTDGLSQVSDSKLIEEWNDFKRERCTRIFSVIAGNDTAGGLEAFSDFVHIVDHNILV